MEIRRDKYLNDLVTRKGNGMIKIVTGIRRCGKTYLVFDLFARRLIESGVPKGHIIALALDDRANERYRDVDALYDYLIGQIGDDQETYYVLLDEVQYAITKKRAKEQGRTSRSLRRAQRSAASPQCRCVRDREQLQAALNRRDDRVQGQGRRSPRSPAELRGVHAGVRRGPTGGLGRIHHVRWPAPCPLHRTSEQRVSYLTSLFDEVYLSDVVERNHLTKSQELEDLVNVLASSIGALTNPSKLEATFKSKLHSKLGADAIRRYLECLEEAFLVSEATRYDVRGRKYIGSPKKYYFEDVGLRNARLGFRQVEESHIMENVIYNELRARGFSVDVGVVDRRMKVDGRDERRRYEVDFVANLGYRRYYIQSALRLDTPEKSEQEKCSLRLIDDSFRKIVVVNRVMQPYMDDDGILTMGLFDFLLDENSLD